MPLHDVSDGFDPTFWDDLICERRMQSVGSTGRSNTYMQRIPFIGVVTSTSPNDLVRVPEQEMMNKSISVYTKFRLQGPSNGYAPDIIEWHGSKFIVRAVDDFSNYGQGFVSVICMSIDSMDPPPQSQLAPEDEINV